MALKSARIHMFKRMQNRGANEKIRTMAARATLTINSRPKLLSGMVEICEK
ncbi:MAG: hypothetical protein KGI99_17735 [Bradyrhizobium sp.]|nr:hypothetical protein [Bradyrhizobium sp.]